LNNEKLTIYKNLYLSHIKEVIDKNRSFYIRLKTFFLLTLFLTTEQSFTHDSDFEMVESAVI